MKFLKYIMIAGLLMVGATSCNDWMDILPESQKRVDRVDTLIRQTEKTMETK